MRGADAVAADHAELLPMLDDSSPDVRVAAAETMGRLWEGRRSAARAGSA